MSIASIVTRIILSIFTLVASLTAPSYTAPIPEMVQDDFVPVMRFVATSDTHIEKLGDTGCQRTSAMLKTAYAISEADADYKNLDAVVFSGDLTDNGRMKSFYAFAAITDNEIREGTERLAVVAKAHDSYRFQNSSLDVFSGINVKNLNEYSVICVNFDNKSLAHSFLFIGELTVSAINSELIISKTTIIYSCEATLPYSSGIVCREV